MKSEDCYEIEFDDIADALAAIRNGECVVVVDDEKRENEGDLICAAQFATPQQINFMATEARGLICLAMQGDRLDQLDLPLMGHPDNQFHLVGTYLSQAMVLFRPIWILQLLWLTIRCFH